MSYIPDIECYWWRAELCMACSIQSAVFHMLINFLATHIPQLASFQWGWHWEVCGWSAIGILYHRSVVCAVRGHCREWNCECRKHKGRRCCASGSRLEWKLPNYRHQKYTKETVRNYSIILSGVHIDSNHCFQRADVTRAEAGQCVSLALKRIRRAAVRKGMVLVTKTETPPLGRSF